MNTMYGTTYTSIMPKRPLVLLVIRSLTIRKVLEVCLSRANFEVLAFSTGSQAIEWARKSPEQRPCILFLDTLIENPSARQTQRQLKKVYATTKTPIVMIARRDSFLERTYSFLCGTEYLAEPFTTQQILALMRDYARPTANTSS